MKDTEVEQRLKEIQDRVDKIGEQVDRCCNVIERAQKNIGALIEHVTRLEKAVFR